MIPLFKHNIGQEEINRCTEVLKSNWHTSGQIGVEVENLISDFYNGSHVALTSSCTSGLMAIAVAIGLAPDDEVIVPAMTFSATAASFMHYGAKPVFVDVDCNGLINIDLIEDSITPKTKAIYVVNLYGHIPDIQKIQKIAKKHNLFLLEDCAHAFEARRNGYLPATYSDAAVYSFYATKTIHCGEGGAVISNNEELINKIRIIRRHGLTHWPSPNSPGNMGYNVVELGFKGILSDIHASLLPGQIKKAEEYRTQRESIANQYYNSFSKLNGIECLMPDNNVSSSWYTFPIKVKNNLRNNLASYLKDNNIGHTIMYESLENLQIYQVKNPKCIMAASHALEQLSLPCYPNLKSNEVEYIISKIESWAE